MKHGISYAYLSLDPVAGETGGNKNPAEKLFPFQELVFWPKEIEGTELLSTLLHTDLLAKFLSLRAQVSSKAPFAVKSIEDNLLAQIPQEIQVALFDDSLPQGMTCFLSRFYNGQ